MIYYIKTKHGKIVLAEQARRVRYSRPLWLRRLHWFSNSTINFETRKTEWSVGGATTGLRVPIPFAPSRAAAVRSARDFLLARGRRSVLLAINIQPKIKKP